ncbi:MAG: hypothetical protein AAGF26_16095 [Cyanobacteria bacterium P01_G01_bin.49]
MRKKRRKKPLKQGTRIRLKSGNIMGWRGTGTVIRDMREEGDWGIVEFTPDDQTFEKGEACRFEVAVLRSQNLPNVSSGSH